MMRALSAFLLICASSCTTYRATSTSSWEHKTATADRLIEVLGVGQTGPGRIEIERVAAGAQVPCVVLACTIPTAVAAHYETRTIPYRERRRAEATLLVRNAQNENFLAYGLGWIVLAPAWVPITYWLATDGAAASALDGALGVTTKDLGGDSCVVEVTLERELEGDGERRVKRRVLLDPRSVPFQNRTAYLHVGSHAIRAETDDRGRLSLPIAMLVESGVDVSAVTIRLDDRHGTRAVLSLIEDPWRSQLQRALERMIDPRRPH